MFKNLKELAYMSKDIKLLYVEDDLDARRTTLNLLKNFFTNITVAVDGADGLEKFKNSKFDLIISDINMPELNGLEMIQEIRKIDSNISVLMLSAHDDGKYFMHAIELGVDGYILKPLNHDQFINVVYKIVEKINVFQTQKNYQIHLEEEVKRRNQEIEHKLHYDSLTVLYSRYMFFNDLLGLNSSVVILIDINQFKVINEVYGTGIGSEVLKRFGDFLSENIKETSYKAYRLSGDEFAILGTNSKYEVKDYKSLVKCLFKQLASLKIVIDDIAVSLDATMAMSNVENNKYECAKIALDHAKKYKKSFIEYSREIDHRDESSLTLKRRDDICSAIDDKRVVAVYQPIVDVTGKIIKYETLMRLQEKESIKLISPYFFLDTAIKTRLYESLSETVIFKALNTIKTTNNSLSINFTYSDIKNIPFIEKIDEFIRLNDGIGERTIVEITEDESIENYEDVKEFIKRFRKYGVRIAIDDFGTGFSNFEYILEVEPDYLKIDGSLVKNIDTNTRSYALVEAIVQFSHKLGIKVIAEFVHSEVVFSMLKELGVDEYQGFYFYEPLLDVKESIE